MRGLVEAAALLLLSSLSHSLVIPSDIASVHPSAPVRSGLNGYGGPDTFFEYDVEHDTIRFKIPCPDCSEEEKQLLDHEIFSIKAIQTSIRSCTSTDPIALEIDGQQLVSTGESNLALQSHVGPYRRDNAPLSRILESIRWMNLCGFTKKHDDEQTNGDSFEFVFVFEILGLASGSRPGFTLSYKQHDSTSIRRFSSYPDEDITERWRFGQSRHYQSPLLQLQKGPVPTVTSFPSSSSISPSPTSSASSPSYTYIEVTSDANAGSAPPATTSSSFAPPLSHPALAPAKDSPPTFGYSGEHHHHIWCPVSHTYKAFNTGLAFVGMKAKGAAQSMMDRLHAKPNTPTSMRRPGVHFNWDQVPMYHEGVKAMEAFHHELDEFLPSSYPHRQTKLVAAKSETSKHSTAHVKVSESIPDTNPTFASPSHEANATHASLHKAVRAFQVTSLVFIVVALGGSIYALIRRNPRLRAEFAARREERRNISLYRKAVRRQRWQHLVNRFVPGHRCCPQDQIALQNPRPSTELDWDEWEKRIAGQSDNALPIEESRSLREDLLAFRKAHRFIDGLLSAEEGQSTSGEQSHHKLVYGRGVRHQRTWSDSNSEKTAPPPYEREESFVTDGLTYTPVRRTTGGTDTTPDSSVVATSPYSSIADSDSETDEKD